MSKEIFKPILVFVIGVVAMLVASFAFMSVINAGATSPGINVLITAAVFLAFGIIVGLFWRGGSLAGGFWLALPFLLATTLSVLFSGFVSKFLTKDLPILATAFIAGVIACYGGQRLTSGRGGRKLD